MKFILATFLFLWREYSKESIMNRLLSHLSLLCQEPIWIYKHSSVKYWTHYSTSKICQTQTSLRVSLSMQLSGDWEPASTMILKRYSRTNWDHSFKSQCLIKRLASSTFSSTWRGSGWTGRIKLDNMIFLMDWSTARFWCQRLIRRSTPIFWILWSRINSLVCLLVNRERLKVLSSVTISAHCQLIFTWNFKSTSPQEQPVRIYKQTLKITLKKGLVAFLDLK
jgi:hypothetical protein